MYFMMFLFRIFEINSPPNGVIGNDHCFLQIITDPFLFALSLQKIKHENSF